MRQGLTFYVTEDQLAYLRREAARYRRSLSSYVASCVLERHQQARAPETPTQGSISPPFEVLLRESEQRIVALITKKAGGDIGQVVSQLTSLAAMLDRFVMSALLHAPEIPPARHAEAISSAERRYRNWRQAVLEMLDGIEAQPPAAWNGAGQEHPGEKQPL